MSTIRLIAAALIVSASPVLAQTTRDPFPTPINTSNGVITVSCVEFAALPDNANGAAARPMLLVDEPETKRLFVNDMFGAIYTVSYDGKTVTPYLDLRDPKWSVAVQASGSERGFQSFALHPDFTRRGARGFGRFYTYTDTSNMTAKADFAPPTATTHTHDTVLLEWTAKNPAAATYDGDAPRELMRFAQPFPNHNGGHTTFNPLAAPRDADYGLLYVGAADGGSGGDPMNLSQNLASAFGKILRIDPLGTNSANGKYGIPGNNPYVADNDPATLGEIYAYGTRNPQRLFWDSKTRAMFMSDVGQNVVEEISPVTAGANLGWNVWEGSFRFVNRQGVDTTNPRGDPTFTYPIVEFDQVDPLFQPNSAAIGGYIYREQDIPQLAGKLLFGDNPSGEIFYVDADTLPKGGQDPIRRVLLNDKGEAKTLLQLIKEKNTAQGRTPATRADLHFGEDAKGQIYIMNKRDGVIRLLVK